MKKKNHSTVAKRLQTLHASAARTWDQIADDLGVNRSMIFHVLSGRRHFSPKILRRLLEIEVAAGLKTSSAALIERLHGENLVEALLSGQSASSEVTTSDFNKGTKQVALEFRGNRPPGNPTTIVVRALSNATIWLMLGQCSVQSDPTRFLLACLPVEQRNPEFLESLSPQCYVKLMETALELTFGVNWRSTAQTDPLA